MIVYVPYTGLTTGTVNALAKLNVLVSLQHMQSDTDYWELLSALWGTDFILCEQDIEPTPEALAGMLACPEPWCSAPYSYYNGMTYAGLGFVRVRAAAGALDQDLWSRVAVKADGKHPKKHWCRLDGHSQVEYRYSIHVHHDTPVGHSNTERPSHNCLEG